MLFEQVGEGKALFDQGVAPAFALEFGPALRQPLVLELPFQEMGEEDAQPARSVGVGAPLQQQTPNIPEQARQQRGEAHAIGAVDDAVVVG